MKNMVSCNAASKVTMLSMGSLKLLLRASVFTVLDIDEMGGAHPCVKGVKPECCCDGRPNFQLAY